MTSARGIGVCLVAVALVASGCGGHSNIAKPAQAQMTTPVTAGVWAWGYGTDGELGNGRTKDSAVPVKVSGLTDVTAVASADTNRYALRADGTVWAWGSGDDGALGNGTTKNSAVPVQVSGLTGVKAIAGGAGNGYALRADGTVWAWGSGSGGALGNGHKENSAVPVQVTGLSKVKAIAGGGGNGLALREDGTVWAWGQGEYGLTGNGRTTDSLVPVRVQGLDRVVKIAIGASMTGNAYALRDDGTVWAWGYAKDGALGTGSAQPGNACDCSPVPAQVSGLGSAKDIAGGYDNGYAVTQDGHVMAWGSALGDGNPSVSELSAVPVEVPGLTQVTAVAAGSSAFALRADGTVWSWGPGEGGALGNGLRSDSFSPVRVLGLKGVAAISQDLAVVR